MGYSELSESGSDPRIADWVLREDIDLSAAPADGYHDGVNQIPLEVLVEAFHVEVMDAVDGDSVESFSIGVSSDASLFFTRDVDIAVGTDEFGFFADARDRSGTEDDTTNIRIFTKQAGNVAAATTSGTVRVTLYGRKFIF
jgi:hypothetical protein